MRFLAIALILVAALANAKNLQRRDNFFNSPTTDPFDISNSEQQNSDQSVPDISNSQPTKPSLDVSNDSDFLEDEDFMKPVQLNAPATVRKAKKPLQVPKLRNMALEYVNFFRRTHAASPLQLHAALTLGAQKWANKIVSNGKISYDKTTTHNQTICAKKAQQDDAVRDCVVSWYAKIMNYDWAHKKINKDNRDVVILLNRATTHIGIGISRGPLGNLYLVCFYSPKVDPNALTENILPYTDVFAAASGVKCQKGYTEYQGTCYKHHTAKKNWMGAVVECAKENAVVADIKSAAAENALKAMPRASPTKLLWIGLNDRVKEGMYSYVDGSAVSHLNWKTGEPQGKNQNCVAIDFKSTFGTMYDRKCTEMRQFICKKPLEGYILYQVTFEMPKLNFEKDFKNAGSIARQKLNARIEAMFKAISKKDSTFIKVFVVEVDDGTAKPKPKPKPKSKPKANTQTKRPAYQNSYGSPYGYNPYQSSPYGHYMGKRQLGPTATAMPSSMSPTIPSSDSLSDSNDILEDSFLENFEDKSKKGQAKPKTPPKKTKVTVVVKYGKSNLKADPTKVFSDYLAKNKQRSAPPLSQETKILSVKLLPPGSEPTKQMICDTSCASTCSSSCSPNCCFQQPTYSSYQSSYSPCYPTQYNPCGQAAAPAPKPPKPKVIYSFPSPKPTFHVPKWQPPPPKPKAPAAAPCTPTPVNPCQTPAFSYGYAPSYQAPPVAAPMAAPCTPTYMNPCQTPAAPLPSLKGAVNLQGYTSPHFGKRSVVGRGSASPCGAPPMSPCGSPMGMQMPMAPPMMPPPMMPQGAPCGAPPMSPCAPPMGMQMPMMPPMQPPMPPPMPPQMPQGAPCGAPPMSPCAPPMGMQMPMMPPMQPPMPFGNPCIPTPANPCNKPKAAKKAKGKKKGTAAKRCGPPPFMPCAGFGMPPPFSMAPPMPMFPPMPQGAPCGAPPMSPCAPPMPPPMPMPMPMPQPMAMPMPFGNPCVPSPYNPCPPKAPKVKKPAVKKPKVPAAPSPLVLNGMTSPFISGVVLPGPPPPYIPQPPMIQFTGSSPCLPSPMNPCAKRAPVARPKPKNQKPVAKNTTPVQSYGVWKW